MSITARVSTALCKMQGSPCINHRVGAFRPRQIGPNLSELASERYISGMAETAETKKAILKLTGATCTSCSITIEHFAKRLDGIEDVYVDRGIGTINLEYDGSQEIIDKIINLVSRLGYEAVPQYIED